MSEEDDDRYLEDLLNTYAPQSDEFVDEGKEDEDEVTRRAGEDIDFVLGEIDPALVPDAMSFLANPVEYLRKDYFTSAPQDLPEHIQALWYILNQETGPLTLRKAWQAGAKRVLQHSEQAQEEWNRQIPSWRITKILDPGEQLPEVVTLRAVRESTRQWMLENGFPHADGLHRARLPDGRVTFYNPEDDPLYSFVGIEGSPDHVYLVLRQWVEVLPGSDDEMKFARKLDANPRWQRTLTRMRQDTIRDSPTVAAMLRLDGLPFTPSVVRYALSCLGYAPASPPLRGGIVTTFLIAVVYNPDDPISKEPYGPFIVTVNPESDWTHEQIIREGSRLQQEEEARRVYHYEIWHDAPASGNWTPLDQYDVLANQCKKAHQEWLMHQLGLPKQFLEEGQLPLGRSRANDWISVEIEKGISAHHTDDEIVAALVHEEERRLSARGISFLKDARAHFKRRVRKRLKIARNTS